MLTENIDKYWDKLPKTIDIDRFKFYNPHNCTMSDIINYPNNNILMLPNDVLDVMMNHIGRKLMLAEYRLTIINYKKKDGFAGRPTIEDTKEEKLGYTAASMEVLMRHLVILYKKRRTHITAMKSGLINRGLYDLFGDFPDKSVFICGTYNIDKFMLESDILARVKRVNELYTLKNFTTQRWVINNDMTLLEQIELVEYSKDVILSTAIIKYG